ncbi:hypothetical protein DICPUDRAFT_159502 [Dictyostelium purpureum]|uniref:EGF-like domain-containing protein n=1 Tax=Dictyostelium purpureum TaxID=5786 RepID=F1A4A3_DICPU|nr:uncharacterized protein DICPUDRAFT_159502 [Dictyostelium purpureum]EGC28978.1 hypothetical protein DICPUDRAFT_159502 [Dictyostelium purpureum]|eukprot:XP_003294498.1 hypothetical protein DICPUDRAFT_159502 [Dictyostelium purpureum]
MEILNSFNLSIFFILVNFILFSKSQCDIGFTKTDYGCNDNAQLTGLQAIMCYGAELGYIGSIFMRIDRSVQACPAAGNPPSPTAYSAFAQSSINKIIDNKITFTQCFSTEKNFNIYYIGEACLSSNDQFVKSFTMDLNGYFYIGSCTNNLSVFKSFKNVSDLGTIRSTECPKIYPGRSEIAYNIIYYGNVQCPNCNDHGFCSNETSYNCNCDKAYLYDEFCRVNFCDQPEYPCNEAKCNRETTECYCDYGYRLNPNTNECIDINECVEGVNGKYPCSINYLCVNQPGGYVCQCPYNSSLNNSSRPCQLECSNKCSGAHQGTCVNSACQCKEGYTGLDCSEINLSSGAKPVLNLTSPSVNNIFENETYESLVFIKEIVELDIYGNILNHYSLNSIKWNFKNITNQSQVEIYTYNAAIIGNDQFETNITVTIQWFKNQSTFIPFANQDLLINPYTLKFNVELSKYNFRNKLCSLQLVIGSAMVNKETTCTSYSVDQNGYDSDYFTLNTDEKSFSCKLLKRGIVDNEIIILSNSFKYLPSENNSTFTSLNLITNIPYYESSLIIDPDFSVLLNTKTDNNNNNNLGKICEKNSGLSKNQLIGIIVGSVCAFIIISVSLIIIIKKNVYSAKIGIKLREIF